MSENKANNPAEISSYFGFYDKAQNATLREALGDLWARVGIDYSVIKNGSSGSQALYEENISQVEATKYAIQYAFDSGLNVFETMRLLIKFKL